MPAKSSNHRSGLPAAGPDTDPRVAHARFLLEEARAGRRVSRRQCRAARAVIRHAFPANAARCEPEAPDPSDERSNDDE